MAGKKDIDLVCFHVISVTKSGGAKIKEEWALKAMLHQALMQLRFVGSLELWGAA